MFALFGLSELEGWCLIQCYHEGHTESQVGEWLGRTTEAIEMAIRRACDKIEGQGMPRPQPYGRGSREELRACFPAVDWDGDLASENISADDWQGAALQATGS